MYDIEAPGTYVNVWLDIVLHYHQNTVTENSKIFCTLYLINPRMVKSLSDWNTSTYVRLQIIFFFAFDMHTPSYGSDYFFAIC